MLKLEIFDPPMCCDTGICGNSTDSTLVTFASDLEWLKTQGVEVVRYGLSFEPTKFAENEAVKNEVCERGNACLPILIINDKIVSKATYPSRKKLAEICKVEFNQDEAPPIHREENCCCGTDCDCHSIGLPEGTCAYNKPSETPAEKCDCTNAAVEENCYCPQDSDYQKPDINNRIQKIIFIVFVIIMAAIIMTIF